MSAISTRVNGTDVKGLIKNGWYLIDQTWKDGDKLIVTLPMDFWLSVLNKGEGRPTAVMYGPLVMAFTSVDLTLRTANNNAWWSYEGMLQTNPDQKKLDAVNLKDIKKQLKPAGDKLVFQIDGDLMLKPFMNYAAGELYYIYLDR
jgi:DUF1680 family protein